MMIRILSLQFALFFKNIIERPDLVFADLNINMAEAFDAIPTILPIPKELPNDVPVVINKSSGGDLSCNISRSRIDLFCNRVSDDKTNAAIFKEFNVRVNSFQQYVTSKIDVVRFGLITRYFLKDDNAIDTIRRKYITDTLGSVSELSLRFNRKESFQVLDVNDVVEISTAEVLIGGRTHRGIIVQRDINNVPQENMSLAGKQLLSISAEFAGRLSEKQIEGLIR